MYYTYVVTHGHLAKRYFHETLHPILTYINVSNWSISTSPIPQVFAHIAVEHYICVLCNMQPLCFLTHLLEFLIFLLVSHSETKAMKDERTHHSAVDKF